ncbi:transposase [Agrobacterium tumefaciens]|uniref:Uncharacterized protein n=1 Tax=Agrobacterium tumefaciens TaxID=358 RepID=A0AAW8M0Y7_AGRTU|nr:transposase [Agrobacterium tumefaciens]MBP2542221.1 hypothetical protein [Agrobacterium tumefaciens]MBP2568071.1 hypothetical protein [Agrobacterium tumefaciens]MDP9791258.1 hypothetical protein [Agrobacterium tumefaciens]MDP9874179.1 hypothetical protein [Agrobacterium tumefaciens]MDP9978775.1 hypothetical protein [Agrobacterium tumefaciens]
MIEAVPDRLDGSPRQLRRFWSDEFKATAVEQACQPGVNMSAVARQIVEVMLHAVRQDDPPCIVSIDYELVVDTEETDQRLQLLNKNVRKYGTISNTIALATRLDGVIRRAS